MTVHAAQIFFRAKGDLDADWFFEGQKHFGWIDFFFRFANEAEAIEEAVKYKGLGRYDNSSPPVWHWDLDYVIPNIRAWRPSQDTADSPPQHVYLTGWFAVVAWTKPARALMTHPKLQFALNREWNPGGSPKNLVVRNNIGAIINDVAVSNVFAGSDYPVGGF